jgi:aspartate carbamoyltransferase catalytic subunit
MNEGVLAIGLIFGLPIIAILTAHHRKVLEIRHQSRANETVLVAVDSLRKEVAELRDTSTRFDLSFDTALQRLESRVEHLENRSSSAPVVSSRVGAGP